MNIEFNILKRQFKKHQLEYEEATLRVLRSGWYILGKECETFEKEFLKWSGSKYCIGLNSGLDALILALKVIGIEKGDEVIVPANTYIATVLAITNNGGIPVFVEPDEYYNIDVSKVEEAITSKTKGILAVHLYGQLCNIIELQKISIKHKLFLIEDCAQSHDAIRDGKKAGTFGNIGCFSFFPTKNLGAFGDAGAIITDDEKIADKIKMLRNYGSKVKYHNEIDGVNSRLDEMQAALLKVKLKHLEELTYERRAIANNYLNGIVNSKIKLPKINSDGKGHVFHLFVIATNERDNLQQYLADNGVRTQIHYPIPPHLAECYKELGYKKGSFPITEKLANEVLSLPLYNGMTMEEVEYVISCINKY